MTSKGENVEAGEAPKDAGTTTVTGTVASNKPVGKCVRVFTVCVYLFAVSFAAIVLSLYYLFIWDPEIN